MRKLLAAAALFLATQAPAQDRTCRFEEFVGGGFRLTCSPALAPSSTPTPWSTPTATPTPSVSTPPMATATPVLPTPTPVTSGCPQFVEGNSPLLCPAYDAIVAQWGPLCFGKYAQLNSALKLNPWSPPQVVRAFQNFVRGADWCRAIADSHDGGETVIAALRQYPDGRCPSDPTRGPACRERWQRTLVPLLAGLGAPAGNR